MEKRSNVRPKLSTADEQYLKVKTLRNKTKIQQIQNSFSGRVAVKEPFLRMGNAEKGVRYAELHKNWNERSEKNKGLGRLI